MALQRVPGRILRIAFEQREALALEGVHETDCSPVMHNAATGSLVLDLASMPIRVLGGACLSLAIAPR